MMLWYRQQDGDTPLYCASSQGEIEIVTLLMDRGAAVDHSDKVRTIALAL